MDWKRRHRDRDVRRRPILPATRQTRGNCPWIVCTGWMLVMLLLAVVANAMPAGMNEASLEADRHRILQAHPEWSPEVREAVSAGIICPGMPADMVLAAWGPPTRISMPDEPGQPETWHYEGRPRAVVRLGVQGKNETSDYEWTVSFIDGGVVAWSD